MPDNGQARGDHDCADGLRFYDDAMRNEHEWVTRQEDGTKRRVRAKKSNGLWRLQSRIEPEEENWTYHKKPLLEDLEELHSILRNKYQRRRATYDDLVLCEKMLKEARRDA